MQELNDHSNVVRGVAWSPDGTTIASIADDNISLTYDADTFAKKKTLKLENCCFCLAFSKNSKYLVIGDTKGALNIFNLSSGDLLQVIQAHDAVKALQFSQDGRY